MTQYTCGGPGQLFEVGFALLPLCGPQGPNSGLQACKASTFPTEPMSQLLTLLFFKKNCTGFANMESSSNPTYTA